MICSVHTDCAANAALASACYARRVAACFAAKGRFAGRAALERRAQYSEGILMDLETRLGLMAREEYAATLTYGREIAARAEQALKGRSFRDPYAGSAPGWARDALAVLRAERAERKRVTDLLAMRPPRHAERVIVERRACEALARARFRQAAHGHSSSAVAVDRGAEGAVSNVSHVAPHRAGLPNAYARKAFFVAQSEHVVHASAAIFDAKVRALNDAARLGELWLSTTTRVVQSRGTTLRVEHVRSRTRAAA